MAYGIKWVTKANFQTQEWSATSAGNKVRKTYQYIINTDGMRQLIENETINIPEEIDSYREETDIKNIVKRAAYDPSVWSAFGMETVEGYSGLPDIDITNAPGTLAEAQNAIIAAKQTFHGLPPEVRAKFNHNPEAFIRSFGSEEWLKAMGMTSDSRLTTYPGKSEIKKQEEKKGMVTDEQE